MELFIQQQEVGSKGAIFIDHNDEWVGEMTYSRASPELIIIDHTEVSDELRGTGAGQAMVEAAVNFARETNAKIIPLCPFALATFKKHPEWHDVLKNPLT